MSQVTPNAEAEWTLARVLALMDEQSRTGILEVSSGQQTTRIHLRRGHVVYAEVTSGSTAWPLGEYLMESGTLPSQTLLEAKEKCDALELALEEYLIEKNLVSEDVLKRFADLHVAEVMFPLFLKTNLNIRFLDERPTNPRYVTALPVNYVLKEADRRAEVWSDLRRRVGSSKAVYSKDDSVLAELLGYAEAPEDEEEALPEISAGARVVFFYVNGRKTVEQLARASGLGVFETYRALGELLDAYLVELVTHEGPGEQPAQRNPSMTKFVTLISYLVLTGLLALGVQWVVSNADTLQFSLTAASAALEDTVETAHLETIEAGLQLYYVQHGEYPESLEELRKSGIVGREVGAMFGELEYMKLPGAHILKRKTDGAGAKGAGGDS